MFYKNYQSKNITKQKINNISITRPTNNKPNDKIFPTCIKDTNTPWWWYDKTIDMDDKLNQVQKVASKVSLSSTNNVHTAVTNDNPDFNNKKSAQNDSTNAEKQQQQATVDDKQKDIDKTVSSTLPSFLSKQLPSPATKSSSLLITTIVDKSSKSSLLLLIANKQIQTRALQQKINENFEEIKQKFDSQLQKNDP